MLSTADILKEIEEAIAHHERELARLHQMKSAAIGDTPNQPLVTASPAAGITTRKRRTKAEMQDINWRIDELYTDSKGTGAEIWRDMVKEGFLRNTSGDRDIVSKRVKRIQKGEIVVDDSIADGEPGLLNVIGGG